MTIEHSYGNKKASGEQSTHLEKHKDRISDPRQYKEYSNEQPQSGSDTSNTHFEFWTQDNRPNMAIVAPPFPKMNTGYSMNTNTSEDRDNGSGFEVGHLSLISG